MKYFIADTHFAHDNIISMMARTRKYGELFSCIEEHDYTIINNINDMVDRSDELIIAGDFAWHNPGKYRQQIKCRNVRLVLGNHDQQEKCRNVFGDIRDLLKVKISSRNFSALLRGVVAHYPPAYWDGSHRGMFQLYGHTHSQREEHLDRLFPGRRAMDVGVDNIFRLFGYYGPISEHDVFDYMIERSGHDDLQHYFDFQSALYNKQGLSHLNPFDKPK